MIFVTVGTTYAFDKLVRAMDDLAPHLNEKVIIQIGNSEYKPKNCEYFDFKPSLNDYIKEASVVISHGGAGTSYEILKMGKKLISIENFDVNDAHQKDLLTKLEQENYIIWCKDLNELYQLIKKAKKTKFKKYISPKVDIHNIIIDFLGEKK